MHLSQPDIDAIAAAFVAARREARILDAFPGPLPTSLADAYRVQERAIALGGRRLAGWKVAMIRPDLRANLGADRICGPIYADVVHDLPQGGGATVTVYDGGFAALEAEFAARFARDLEPGPDGFDDATILAALASLHAGSEVASSPLPTLNDIGPVAVVCDHGNNAGAVVGPELPGWRTTAPAAFASKMLVDGVVEGEGSAASVPGGPLGALRFLAEQLATRGRHLAAGDVVLTGMTTGIHTVRPGSHGRIVFSGVSDCDIAVVAVER
ncbi:2-keto-4-pentenoate hydratase [Siculibacillus lacustris]|uniref:2-keto-4-pentenoate hydratase n=1 Tax=Siculibacillus lacustris TaxID=1549641 RepID=A0A4Q9VP90_9HYPH|nr:2-keto-4-pentenoate hydratase [Siculibacillus lacustris]TBW37017.1 2-keto-4-pentenoate hydratase [Siculibacillus lacustris]